MDKRNEGADKNYKNTDHKVKDRGDLRKLAHKMLKRSEGNTQMGLNLPYPERGDSERQLLIDQTTENLTLNTEVKKPLIEGSKLKKTTPDTNEKKNYDKDESGKSYTELRKRIRDRYTLKLNGPANKSDHLSMHINKKDEGCKAGSKTEDRKPVERPKRQLAEETTQTKEKLNNSPAQSIKTDLDKKPDRVPTKPDKIITKIEKSRRNSPKRRKPMVKTITSKTGKLRVFKAVTFVDQTSPATPLEIKIPVDHVKKTQKVSKYTETSSIKINPNPSFVSKTSTDKERMPAVRKKAERGRERKLRQPQGKRHIDALSPPTEVARWAPESIDHHTKPYYEAWVDTTLAAISKHSQREALNSTIMRSFRKIFTERPSSPELFYANYNDERYTGKIKVTQR